MSDIKDANEIVVPSAMADLEWVWVLAANTQKSDAIFVIEMEDKNSGETRRIVPIFETREDAAKLKFKLCQHHSRDYDEQNMRLTEVGRFAAAQELEIMLLDESGSILAHMEAKMEKVAVH